MELNDLIKKNEDLAAKYPDMPPSKQATQEIDLTQLNHNEETQEKSQTYIIQLLETTPENERYAPNLKITHEGETLSSAQLENGILHEQKTKIEADLCQKVTDSIQAKHPKCDLHQFIPNIITNRDHRIPLSPSEDLCKTKPRKQSA